MIDIILFYGPDEPYFELANYYERTIMLDGEAWPTVEHYFQSQKTNLPEWREKIRTCGTPDESKKLGWEVPDYHDDNWLKKRESVMETAVRAKFDQHLDLREILLSTKDSLLIEDSPVDQFWGMVDGKGQNKMGRLLMRIRDDYLV